MKNRLAILSYMALAATPSTPGAMTTDGAGNWIAVWVSEDSAGDTMGLDDDMLVAF